MDNTERLYKSMREARIWREEHRHTTDALADSSVVATAGGKATDEADDKNGGRLRNGAGGGLSESTSCMDATVMATWGGDSDRDEPNEDIGEEYIEDIPSVVSSRSSRANRRFLNVSVEGDASSTRESLGVRIDTQDSSGICMRLPDLGYSPSPRTSGGNAVSRPSTAPTRTSHLHRRQFSRTSRSNRSDLADISFSGGAGDPIIKILAESALSLHDHFSHSFPDNKI